jgi:hypothetical protein
MAKKSIAQLEAALEAEKSKSLGLATELLALQLRLKHDYVERAEYNRVQGVLRTTQQFMTKYKREARPGSAAAQRGPDGETLAQRTIREHREAQAVH